ncbi:MAG: hypothetical protein ACXW4C_11710, partial [Nitrospira sp.]
MNSSMVICGVTAGAAAGGVVGGVAVAVGAAEVDGEGIDCSLTGFTPGFDSIRGKRGFPIFTVL